MIVLSLFDGVSCGRVALERLNIKVDKYYACEIDKKAIETSKKNNPDIIHIGNVLDWRKWDIEKPDLIMGGSPCQGFSFAGKQLAFDDPRSKLFFTMMDIIEHYEPKYKLLENVRMKKQSIDVITDHMGVAPHLINSSLVSAQNRQRYYWYNWDSLDPCDKKINLSDVLDLQNLKPCAQRGRYDKNGKTSQKIEYQKLDKANALTTVAKDSFLCDPKTGKKRNFTRNERALLQGLPANYFATLTDNQALKAAGNGWNVDTICHILLQNKMFKEKKGGA